MKFRAFCLFASIFGAGLSVLTVQPTTSYATGINVDAERQACHYDLVRAKRANRQMKAGEISPTQRRNLWLKYRDCLGGKDKNYLLPAEFKYK